MRGMETVMTRAAMLAWVMAALLAAPAWAATSVSHGRFENVPLHLPDGPVQRVVLWFAGEGGAAQRQARVQALREDGALVVDIDTRHLYRVLAKEGGSCAFSAGDVENLSRYVQAWQHVPGYRLPILGGDGEGAALAYAVAVQAAPGVFAGLLTEGFCPRLQGDMVCDEGSKGRVLVPAPLRLPWLQAAATPGQACTAGEVDGFLRQVPLARRFKRNAAGSALPGEVAAARVMGARREASLPPVPHELDDLPLVEVPAAGKGDTLALFVSGDGGWAGLDKDVAATLAQSGIAVVGVDSLRYFWSARTPAGFATDLDRIARHYRRRWQRSRLLLIGFSQGADVLPAAINQLPADTRARLAMSVLLSPGERADYEFHVGNWLGGDSGHGLPIAPEMRRLAADRTVCVYGQEDDQALCPHLPAGSVQVVRLPGDHHFQGDHAALARLILGRLRALSPAGGAGPAK
ncbi:MAG: AcvB/VirJ family lysyl-phosphatidylglycerol hydrolase [Stenotrophomonas sp.]